MRTNEHSVGIITEDQRDETHDAPVVPITTSVVARPSMTAQVMISV